MLVVLIGLSCSAKSTIAQYLVDQEGFERVEIGKSESSPNSVFASASSFLDYATLNWRRHFVTTHRLTRQEVRAYRKRPWVLLVRVEAPSVWRYHRHVERAAIENTRCQSLLEFITADDGLMHGAVSSRLPIDEQLLQLPSGPMALPKALPTPPGTPLLSLEHMTLGVDQPAPLVDLLPLTNLTIRPAAFQTVEALHRHLQELNLTNEQRVRPSWDDYFMTLAELASLRSNCMKRRVGAVLISSTRKVVISTGYNGTPRGMVNCAQGGCDRCNSASKLSSSGQAAGPVRSGTEMEECLCLHAEENALLEAGRERAGAGEGGGTLYCNTCPCLRCTVKIVQCGIKEVVYSQSYSMDDNSAAVFAAAGVQLRQIALKGGG